MAFQKIEHRAYGMQPLSGVTVGAHISGPDVMTRVSLGQNVLKTTGWAFGQRVALLVGTGPDAGWICLKPTTAEKGAFAIRNASRTTGIINTTRLLRTVRKAEAADYEIRDGALFVRLPQASAALAAE